MLIDTNLLGESPYNPMNFPLWTDLELRVAWTNPILIIAEEGLEDLPVLTVSDMAIFVPGFQALRETQALIWTGIRLTSQLSRAHALAESLLRRQRTHLPLLVERVNLLLLPTTMVVLSN